MSPFPLCRRTVAVHFFSRIPCLEVLQTQGEPLPGGLEEIDSLVVSHPRGIGVEPLSHLGVPHVAGHFLALSVGPYIFEQTAVEGAVEVVVHGIVEHFPVVRKDGEGKDGVHEGSVPVAVGFGRIVADVREKDFHEKGVYALRVLFRPSGIGITQDLGGIAECLPVKADDEFRVVFVETAELAGPGVYDFNGFLRVGFLSGDIP